MLCSLGNNLYHNTLGAAHQCQHVPSFQCTDAIKWQKAKLPESTRAQNSLEGVIK